MLEVDFDDLDLGSKRKPTEWVTVLPPSAHQPRQRSSRSVLKAQKAQRAQKMDDKPQGAVKKQGRPLLSHAARMQQLAACTDVRQPRPISEEDAAAGAQAFPPEDDEGNVEYKLRLKEPNCSPVRFQQLVTQMKFRLAEGNGECFYFIGIEDDGYPRGLTQADMDVSLASLRAMAEEVHAATTLLRKAAGTRKRHCTIVRVHKLCVDDVGYTDLRIAVAGSVDAGKSSLVGVLTHGVDGRPLLDNGCGSARMNVFQHKHEIETGRTSSLTHQMLGYDEEGKVLNYAGVSVLTPAEMSTSARRVLRFIDLGGHEKYLKTALYGMTCMLPDYVLVCVCPLTGLSRVSHEHLAVALALGVPVACVITKTDAAPAEALEQVLQDLRKVIGAAASAGVPQTAPQGPLQHVGSVNANVAPIVQEESQAVRLAKQVGSQRSCHRAPAFSNSAQQEPQPPHAQRAEAVSRRLSIPIFMVSSVTGSGLPLLHAFLHALPAPLQTPTPTLTPPNTLFPISTAVFEGSHNSTSSNSSDGSIVDGVVMTDTAQPDNSISSEPQALLSNPGVVHDSRNTVAGEQPTHFQVDHTYEVKGVGCVVSGTVIAGTVAVGQTLNLGPHGQGGFSAVEVTCIQRSQVPVRHVGSGQHATVALQPCLAQVNPPSASDTYATAGSHSTECRLMLVHSETAPAMLFTHQQADNTQSTVKVSQQPGLLVKPHGVQPNAASDMPYEQQADRYLLDHRIHHSTAAAPAVAATQPLSSTAVAAGILPYATAVAPLLSHKSSAPIDILRHGAPASSTAAYLQSIQQSPDRPCHMSAGQGSRAVVNALEQDSRAVTGALGHAATSPSIFSGSEPPNARKGVVLLDPATHTCTTWEFQAVIVLLNGHWPARGLLSGRWPPHPQPHPQTPDTVLSHSLPESPLGASDSDQDMASPGARNTPAVSDLCLTHGFASADGSGRCGMQTGPGCLERPCLHRPSKKKHSAIYLPVIHCGSVRQAALVVAMEELIDAVSAEQANNLIIDGCDMTSAIAAAKALRGSSAGSLHDKLGSAPTDADEGTDFGTLARVTFRFQQRPEWLLAGSRLIVRDRTDGCTAGAGVICKLL